jgi:hypothetical protein
MSGALRIAVVLVAAVTATIVANVVLLGVASGRHDPVGRLNPQAALVSAPTRPVLRPAPPAAPVRPHEHEHADD